VSQAPLEWTIRGAERMDTDGLLYIQQLPKSEVKANIGGTKVLEPWCLTSVCGGRYRKLPEAAWHASHSNAWISGFSESY
jgi:hypothetical protein